MEYENFKENLLAGIKNFYGDGAEIKFERVLKNNGQYYDGVRIAYKDSEKIVPVIYIDEIYDKFLNGELSMKKCVLKVCKLREDSELYMQRISCGMLLKPRQQPARQKHILGL